MKKITSQNILKNEENKEKIIENINKKSQKINKIITKKKQFPENKQKALPIAPTFLSLTWHPNLLPTKSITSKAP